MKKNLLFLFCCLCFTIAKSQTPGNIFFGSGNLIHTIYIQFNNPNWYTDLQTNFTTSTTLDSNIYMLATVTVDGVQYDSVGVRFKGNSSYNNPSTKKSFKLSFEEFKTNNALDGMKQINLNNGFKDPSFLREKLMLDFLNNHSGCHAPRCHFSNVYVEGNLYAFYTVVEEVEKSFLKTHFGNKGGNLFKGDPHGDLKYLGNSTPATYYPHYELKTNDSLNDWTDLVTMIAKLNQTPAAQLQDTLDKYFNTADYIKMWAATILFSDMDSYAGSGHNYYIYHNTATNKMEWIMWDVNEAFGNFHLPPMPNWDEDTMTMYYLPTPSGNRPLNEKMMANANYKTAYKTAMCEFLNDFTAAKMNPMIDTLANKIRPYVYADNIKFFSNADFETNLTSATGPSNNKTLGLKSFIANRNAYLTNELNGFDCSTGGEAPSTTLRMTEGLELYPNPTKELLVIELLGYLGNANTIHIYDVLGRECISPLSGGEGLGVRLSKAIELNVSSLSSGVYFVKVTDEKGNVRVGKFVKE